MKVRQWTIHAIFWCDVCGLQWENHRTARKQGLAHFNKTGHVVVGEVGKRVEFHLSAKPAFKVVQPATGDQKAIIEITK